MNIDEENTMTKTFQSYKDAEKLNGEGDAEAIKIYAQAFEKDLEFY